ncbi:hypothetical protein GX586_06105 [bacterium]|nr:hypothetical protein [bacterium]
MKPWLSICLLCCAAAPAAVSAPPEQPGAREVPAFLEGTVRQLRATVAGITTLVARAHMVRRTAGLREPVNADCAIAYAAPDVLRMDVAGPCGYLLLVSNGVATTASAGHDWQDVRPLAGHERVLDDVLGIATFADGRAFDFQLRVEGDETVITAYLRPDQREKREQAFAEYGRSAMLHVVWLNTVTGRIRQTRVRTLGGDDTTLSFRELWINGVLQSQ